MTNAQILTTTGFILPENLHFEVLTKEKLGETSVFKRTALVTSNSTMTDLVATGQIYHSPSANAAFLMYEASGKFEDFMRMVDIASTILGSIEMNKFFELQANNRHLSMYSFKLCSDLLSCKFLENFHEYSTIPANVRFCADNNNSASQFASNVKTLHKSKCYGANTWERLLTGLTNDRTAFATFFKYVFVDSY